MFSHSRNLSSDSLAVEAVLPEKVCRGTGFAKSITDSYLIDRNRKLL